MKNIEELNNLQLLELVREYIEYNIHKANFCYMDNPLDEHKTTYAGLEIEILTRMGFY